MTLQQLLLYTIIYQTVWLFKDRETNKDPPFQNRTRQRDCGPKNSASEVHNMYRRFHTLTALIYSQAGLKLTLQIVSQHDSLSYSGRIILLRIKLRF